MRPNLKKLLALILALVLVLPAFTLAEDDAAQPAPEIVLEDQQADGAAEEAATPEATEAAEADDGESEIEIEDDDARI